MNFVWILFNFALSLLPGQWGSAGRLRHVNLQLAFLAEGNLIIVAPFVHHPEPGVVQQAVHGVGKVHAQGKVNHQEVLFLVGGVIPAQVVEFGVGVVEVGFLYLDLGVCLWVGVGLGRYSPSFGAVQEQGVGDENVDDEPGPLVAVLPYAGQGGEGFFVGEQVEEGVEAYEDQVIGLAQVEVADVARYQARSLAEGGQFLVGTL